MAHRETTTSHNQSNKELAEQALLRLPSEASSRNDDALELAQLLYDLYKHGQANGKIEDGQNNANDTKDT